MSKDDSVPVTHVELRRALKEHRKQMNEDFAHALAVANEQLVHDFGGIFNDRTQQHSEMLAAHEQRMERLETHLGFQPML